MKRLKSYYFLIIYILFLEIVLSFLCFNNFLSIQSILFSIPIGLVFGILCHLFKSEKINKVIFIVINILLPFIYCAQLVYFKIYESFFSIAAIGMAGQVTAAADQIKEVIINNIGYLFIFLIPIILNIFLSKRIWNFQKNSVKHQIILLSVVLIIHGISLGLLHIDKKGTFSNYKLYTGSASSIKSVERFGLLTTMRIEVQKNLLGTENDDFLLSGNINENYEQNEEIKYQQIDINWDKIIEGETNKNIKQVHQYFSSRVPTEQNEYTGMFEGKNVVFVLAESLYSHAISEELTPTLYKMRQEGFQFNNYYVPLYPTSTADGEYMLEWGLLPIIGNAYNINDSAKNLNPYGFVNAFSNLGYKVSAYHGFAGYYYNRERYFKYQGYQDYGFCDTNLKMKCSYFHASDLKMVQNSINRYINEDTFFTYYISISGHGGYDYSSNFIVRQNWDYVKDLSYPNYLKGYLAGTIELDRALEYLMQELEKAGKLEDTVFVISPDHWPYYFKTRLKDLEPIAGDVLYDEFEVHKNSLIIYNSGMENPIPVDKVTTNIDVLPTLLNLMGVEYDSRLLIGTDALSNNDGLIIFQDYSWITDLGRYNGKEFIPSEEGITVDDEYIESINAIVKQKITVSSLIQKNNYYKKLFDEIEKMKEITEEEDIEVNEENQE